MNGVYADKIRNIIDEIKIFNNEEIEASIIAYVSSVKKINFIFNKELGVDKKRINKVILDIFNKLGFPVEIEFIIELFEALIDKNNKNENGIVFTPKYIADYINYNCIQDFSDETKIIDPSCGCGIFIISAAEMISKKYKIEIKKILNNNVYGIEIDEDNVRRCKIVLNLYCLFCGEDNSGLKLNVICKNSLEVDWNKEFKTKSYNYIIGNPPYVNTHDMNKSTTRFLKKNFCTTKSGVFNIFYAFIEQSIKFLEDNGKISFILPNNFLTIKSAFDLRKFIIDNYLLESIIDFRNNMVFKPIRTYNCIIKISKTKKKYVDYKIFCDGIDIQKELQKIKFDRIEYDSLGYNSWNFVSKKNIENINKIENQPFKIKDFIRTGIATLRDNIYYVNFDSRTNSFYKIIDSKKYKIDSKIVRKIYKISDIDVNKDINEVCRYIIFPYKKIKGKYEIIDEIKMKSEYSSTYNYLLSQKKSLDERDKGKKNPVAWYAYGRTQGLNKYGKKLLFPTFAYEPKFIKIEDENSLFCNGYAIFENDYFDLDFLQKILNSKVMMYYVSNTSYTIEGGFFCYQKKYIENFSLPMFDEQEIKRIKKMEIGVLDEYLIKKYGITL